MQITNQAQRSNAAYQYSETLAAQTQFQLRALDNTSAVKQGNETNDQVDLSPGALNQGRTVGKNSNMASLLGMLESILQHVLGASFTTAAANTQPEAAKTAGSEQLSALPLDTLTTSILSALQGENGTQAAKSGGNQNSLLAALQNMGNQVENDALSLFDKLSAQNQSWINGLAASGTSGTYQSLVSVQTSETYSLSLGGQLTTASGQSYQFSLQLELQASVSMTSIQSGTFDQNTQADLPQSLQLGDNAGLLSGAMVNIQWLNLLKNNTTDDPSGKTNTPEPSTDAIGQAMTSALATLKLTPEQNDLKQTPLQQHISALVHRRRGRQADEAAGQMPATLTNSTASAETTLVNQETQA